MEKMITLRVPEKVADALEKRAEDQGVNKSTLVRKILIQYLGLGAGKGPTPYEQVKDLIDRIEAVEPRGVPLLAAEAQEEYLRNTMGRKHARHR